MKPSTKSADELLRRVPNTRQRLSNYERKLSKLIQRTGPSGLVPIDLSKPAVKGSRPEGDVAMQSEQIAALTTTIQAIKDEVGDVINTVALLDERERRLIELWYFKGLKKDEIAERLYYAGRTSVYKLHRRALLHFVELYPW